jgi:U4/U6.U5 tri-snRNP component SNU23
MSKELSKKKAAGVDNTARRTWDKEEFREKAEKREADIDADEESAYAIKKRKRLERDPLHQGLIVARSNLQKRDYEINLTDRLNKTQVIGLNTPLNQQAGYYCSVCDCVLRDSQSYLDHINGKFHNRALGMSMRVEKSTVEQVSSTPQVYIPPQSTARATAHVANALHTADESGCARVTPVEVGGGVGESRQGCVVPAGGRQYMLQ